MNTTRHSSRGVALLAALVLLAGAFAQAADDGAKEKELIEILRSAAPAEKAVACKHLAVYGTKNAVPELAKLLADEQLASWARIALEAIPDPAADEALRKATDTLKGRLLVGTINSIGVRRDQKAVDRLIGHLKDQDADVAASAAGALGHIGGAAATKSLRESLKSSEGAVRSAMAEGCILCAERLLAEGKTKEAAELYDAVRKAELPKQRIREATRGAILARKSDGIPLLIEQLKSPDKGMFQIALGAARELPGREVAEALAGELAGTAPDRAALLLYALADRDDSFLPPAVLGAAKSGDKQVRIAAIDMIGRLGDASSVPVLLEIAIDKDGDLSQTAKTALAGLPGAKVNAEVAARLPKAEGKTLAVLIDLVGQRRIDATAPLIKAVDHSDEAIRAAALTALGETVGPKQLDVLISQVIAPKHPGDADAARRALRAACVRMPEREACAAELAAAMPRASTATKSNLLEILGAMGGPKALATIGDALKSGDDALQDTGSRVLGEWMSVDAAPVLLDLAKSPSADKYQVRALRGYIRLARQFAMPDAQRAEMCGKALDAATRTDEQKLVLAVLERYPSVDTLKVAVKAAQTPELKTDAGRVAMAIAQKLGAQGDEVRELLAKIGLEPLKVEIIKAEYGAGATQKDVTEALRKATGALPLITLPAASYNGSFGGDPAPNTAKQLKIKYRINGKEGEASFAENAAIVLPMPK
ncbi:MAG TPA: HEAT repeat domain-containing protein [Pirellulales bacterium]|nr:HEAT repeat domain-containing protein [Pirellulales bacterium]